MSDNVIQLPGTQERIITLSRRLDAIEQVVIQLDSNLAAFTLGASIVIEALKKLLIQKGLITQVELDEIVDELTVKVQDQITETMRDFAKRVTQPKIEPNEPSQPQGQSEE